MRVLLLGDHHFSYLGECAPGSGGVPVADFLEAVARAMEVDIFLEGMHPVHLTHGKVAWWESPIRRHVSPVRRRHDGHTAGPLADTVNRFRSLGCLRHGGEEKIGGGEVPRQVREREGCARRLPLARIHDSDPRWWPRVPSMSQEFTEVMSGFLVAAAGSGCPAGSPAARALRRWLGANGSAARVKARLLRSAGSRATKIERQLANVPDARWRAGVRRVAAGSPLLESRGAELDAAFGVLRRWSTSGVGPDLREREVFWRDVEDAGRKVPELLTHVEASLMDAYLLARLGRVFRDGTRPGTSVVYAGDAHIQRCEEFFSEMGSELLARVTPRTSRCLRIPLSKWAAVRGRKGGGSGNENGT